MPRFAWLLAALLGAAVVMVLAYRQPLAEWIWPETPAQQLREQARAALAQGRLSAADGSGARQLYEAALALEPDRDDAREGLAQVGQAALGQARAAIARQRFGDAHRSLRLARDLAVPRAEAQAVAELLREREARAVGIDTLLVQAASARADGRLDGSADAALPLYARVLALQPDRTEALEGREDALADLLQQASDALRRGQLDVAADIVRRARGYDRGHLDLPEAQSQLVRAAEQRRRQADQALEYARLDAALAGYREALLANPGDAAAGQGIEKVAAAWARRAERQAADFQFAPAAAALRRAQAIAPDQPAVRAAEAHLQRARRAQAGLDPRVAPAARERQVRELLVAAAAAQARGQLLTPPGESAFDKLRAARALAPDDAGVTRAIARVVAAAQACFERELRGNNLGRAGACLDAHQQLGGSPADLRAARGRLALRWIAVGDERLGAGDVALARRALAAARALDPAAPGLDRFAERVGNATAAGE